MAIYRDIEASSLAGCEAGGVEFARMWALQREYERDQEEAKHSNGSGKEHTGRTLTTLHLIPSWTWVGESNSTEHFGLHLSEDRLEMTYSLLMRGKYLIR